ncbi:MAG: hypothetical protein ACHQ53_12595 [Polyangiales bacterium]
MIRAVLVTMVAFGMAGAGCGGKIPNCPAVEGTYLPEYRPLSGSCGPISNPFAVPIDGGHKGVNMIITNLPNGRVSTDIVMKGCSMRVTQTVQDAAGQPASTLDGDPIYVQNENELSGTVSFMQFDPTTGSVACSGMYEARFTKQSSPVGGALGH